MSSTVPSKIFIQVETSSEQQENLKNSRKAFNTLQTIGGTIKTDKENLIKRSPAYIAKESLIKKASVESDQIQTQEIKRKQPTATTSSQTSPAPALKSGQQIAAEDLTEEKPVNEHYWELLAEKRRTALEETLSENQELYQRIADLEDELNQSKSMLEEARDLVTVLTEMLEEKEGGNQEIDHTRGSVETEEEPSDTSGTSHDLDITM